MFTWLNKQGVKSDLGFEFQFTGQFTAEYREGSRVARLSVEPIYKGVVISEASLAPLWRSAPEPLRGQRRDQILKNVREAVEFQNLIFELS